MANVITGRQWVLDTLGAVWTDGVKILHMEYVGYDVASDVGVLKDRNGRVLWIAQGQDDLSNVVSQDVMWSDGLTVDDLGGSGTGKFLVYIQ